MSDRDRIARELMAQQRSSDVHLLPSPWPVPPGEKPLTHYLPEERDVIERAPIERGTDQNAIQGDDLLRQYLYEHPELDQERT